MGNQEQLSAVEKLKSALEERGLCVWPVNHESDAFKLGLFWGVTLSWPGAEDKIQQEIETMQELTKFVAAESHFSPNLYDNPSMAAGGALVVYCGFETPFLILAREKARETGEPIWKVVKEDRELQRVKTVLENYIHLSRVVMV